jgi:hypothetical protein
VDSPGFCKPVHGYGQPFGTAPDDTNDTWAGTDYTRKPEPVELEPVDDAA